MRRAWIVWVAAVVLLLAACGDDTEPDTAIEPSPEAPTEQEEEDDLAIVPTVTTAETDVGEALVDPDGRSLYLFENDEGGESSCYDDCADNWPPLLTTIAPYSSDEDMRALLGTHTREDGASQVTYNGRPLYYYAGDDDPGDTSGQGVGDVWWLVDPAGEPIKDTGP